MENEKFFLIWSTFALIIGGMLAFGPVNMMRGYHSAKNDDKQLKKLITFNRVGGLIFFILGNIVLLFLGLSTALKYFKNNKILLTIVLIIILSAFLSEIIFLIKLKKGKKVFKFNKKVLIIISILINIVGLGFFLKGSINKTSILLFILFYIVMILIELMKKFRKSKK